MQQLNQRKYFDFLLWSALILSLGATTFSAFALNNSSGICWQEHNQLQGEVDYGSTP